MAQGDGVNEPNKGQEKTDAELIEEVLKLEFDKVMPFEVVQGDCIHRTNPGSRVQLNTTRAWLVSQFEPAHRLRNKAEELQRALTLLPELASRLKSANGRLDAANDVKAAQKIVLEHLEKELKSANELLDERLKQVAVMHIELRVANEKLSNSARILPVRKREDFFCVPDADFIGEPSDD